MAIYTETKGSARGPNGFSPTFAILQGTRDGCILSPLPLLIFFSDAVNALERVQLEGGAVLLGAMALSAILFADDVVLLARSLSDLQRLLNTFSAYCDRIHEQIALDKTEAVLCSGPSHSCLFFMHDGALYEQRILKRALFIC